VVDLVDEDGEQDDGDDDDNDDGHQNSLEQHRLHHLQRSINKKKVHLLQPSTRDDFEFR